LEKNLGIPYLTPEKEAHDEASARIYWLYIFKLTPGFSACEKSQLGKIMGSAFRSMRKLEANNTVDILISTAGPGK